MSTLSDLKKYSTNPKYASQFAKAWDSASDSDRNTYRNWSISRINRLSKRSFSSKIKRTASKRKSSGSSGG